MPRKTTVPFPENKTYIKRDLRDGDQIDKSSPYIENGEIYRDIKEHPPLMELVKSGLSKELAAQGYIPEHELEGDRLHMEFIPWCVYPTEHSLRQLRDGLLRILELVILLNKRGFTFRDISWRQVGLKYSQVPLLVDIGSIYKPVGTYKGILKKHLGLWADKIKMPYIDNNPPQLLKTVRNYIPKSPNHEWDKYDPKGRIAKRDNPEIDFLSRWLKSESTQIKNVLDAGANRGRISKYVATELEIPVLACDTSDYCVSDLYLWAQERKAKITSLKWNIMVPPKWINYDWMLCDAFIASSLTHHLYRAGHNFVEQEKVIRALTKKLALIEYIGPKDFAIKPWNAKWTEQEFEQAFSSWKLLEKVALEPQTPYRTWYAFLRRGL